MVRYYLYAELINDQENYSLNDSPIALQEGSYNHFNPGLWVPKPKVIFLESISREIAINWHSEIYNMYFCEFKFGDNAFKEYVEKLLEGVKDVYANRPIKYIISKGLN